MTDELKPLLPCPCCNGTPSLMHGPGGDIWVKCPVCGLQTEMHPNNAAIAAWNWRVESNELPGWLRDRLNDYIINCLLLVDELRDDGDIEEAVRVARKGDVVRWILSLRREDAE